MRELLVAAVVFSAQAGAHRLDEYLQGTIVSIEKNRVQARMTLTPGVAVYPKVLAAIDTDGDGTISAAERQAYAERVLGDLSLAIDGHRLTPELSAVDFPGVDEMKEGRGEIHIEFSAAVVPAGGNRKLIIENHHQSQIAAYQVNCLVPRDADLRIVSQNRNYSQSRYELDYVQAGMGFSSLSLGWRAGDSGLAGLAALLLVARMTLLRRNRASALHQPRA